MERRLQGILDFEAALAWALALADVIPRRTADSIANRCSLAHLDIDRIREDAPAAGNEAIPVVEQLRTAVAKADPEAAAYVHWGATSQDALDTSLALWLRAVLADVERSLASLARELARLAGTHADTPMIGRTLLQQAAPITFGFKAATWLDGVLRVRTRVARAREEMAVLQFGGAVGTLAALGEVGPRVTALVADVLKLQPSPIAWHATRDRIANVAATLGIAAGTAGKIARDVGLLAQTEIDELREGGEAGRGRSSTMPQKRNPVLCASVISAATRAPGLVANVMSAMMNENERGLGPWQAEWQTLSDLCVLTLQAVDEAAALTRGLEVRRDRMRANIEASRGLIFAEAIAFTLVPRLGRDRAMTALREAIGRVGRDGTHLRDELLADDAVRSQLTTTELDALFDATRHLGHGPQMARAMAAAAASVSRDADTTAQ